MTGLTAEERHLTSLACAVRAEKGAEALGLPAHCNGQHLAVTYCAGGLYVQYGRVFGMQIGMRYKDARRNLLDMLQSADTITREG